MQSVLISEVSMTSPEEISFLLLFNSDRSDARASDSVIMVLPALALSPSTHPGTPTLESIESTAEVLSTFTPCSRRTSSGRTLSGRLTPRVERKLNSLFLPFERALSCIWNGADLIAPLEKVLRFPEYKYTQEKRGNMRLSTLILGIVVLASGCVGGQQQAESDIPELDQRIGEFAKSVSTTGETGFGTGKTATFTSNDSKVSVEIFVFTDSDRFEQFSITERYPNASTFSLKQGTGNIYTEEIETPGNTTSNTSEVWRCLWRKNNLAVSASGVPGNSTASRGEVRNVCTTTVETVTSR
jgi:hypothetical protein